MRMIPVFVGTLAGLLVAGIATAQTRGSTAVDQQIQFAPAVVTDVQVQTNRFTAEGIDAMRKALPNQTVTFPASWRLVSVVARPRTGGAAVSSEYVLFFQDDKTRSVHSLVMDENGDVAGRGAVRLQAR
ncbi:MAG: hypothetical protein IPK34_16395 [Ramlibacter sp.]|jgi:hypothetical protein|nr:hypothetical protein [Ramlibacter sp.]